MAAGPTYEPIATTTLSTSTATVTFSSISSSYTDLLIIANVKQTTSNNGLRFRFNSDTGTNYSSTYVYGNGSSAISGRESSISSGYAVYTSSNTSLEMMAQFHIFNYANNTTYKTTIGRGARASEMADATVSLWRSTSAITSISLAAGAGFPTNNFDTGSTFTLYGIKAA